jgi:hypothetical protein
MSEVCLQGNFLTGPVGLGRSYTLVPHVCMEPHRAKVVDVFSGCQSCCRGLFCQLVWLCTRYDNSFLVLMPIW